MLISILYNSISYFLFLNISFVSITGFGFFLTKVSNFKPLFVNNIFHYFVMGLIFIGSISILINIFFNLNDYYSIIIIKYYKIIGL